MKISTNSLIDDLLSVSKNCISEVKKMKEQELTVLQQKSSKEAWSALECIEHLNRYGNFYLPEIDKVLMGKKESSGIFKSGLIGNYFAKSMQIKPKLNKMKTFRTMNPINSDLKKDVLEKFLGQQEEMLKLLNKAKQANLTKLKTKISISNYLKLRLGDTLRVVVYHNERHIIQAKNALFN